MSSRNILDGIKVAIRHRQVAKPLGLHVRDDTGINTGEGILVGIGIAVSIPSAECPGDPASVHPAVT